ncbi:hypothetical protein EMCRGX_G026111 [Ephydatia muelleri]
MLINQVYEDGSRPPTTEPYMNSCVESKNSLQQAEEKLEALQQKMKARLPLGLQEEVSQALQLIRITLQKSEQ